MLPSWPPGHRHAETFPPPQSLDKIQWPTVLRHAQFVVGFMVEASSVGNGGPTAARGPKNRTKKPKRGSR